MFRLGIVCVGLLATTTLAQNRTMPPESEKQLARAIYKDAPVLIRGSVSGRDRDEEDPPIKSWEGPPPALWVWEMATGKVTRVTPGKLLAMEGCWLDDGRILTVTQAPKEKEFALIAKAAGFESIWDDVREAKFHMDRVRRLSLLRRDNNKQQPLDGDDRAEAFPLDRPACDWLT